jgi:hypothetical protein
MMWSETLNGNDIYLCQSADEFTADVSRWLEDKPLVPVELALSPSENGWFATIKSDSDSANNV